MSMTFRCSSLPAAISVVSSIDEYKVKVNRKITSAVEHCLSTRGKSCFVVVAVLVLVVLWVFGSVVSILFGVTISHIGAPAPRLIPASC